MGAANEVEGHVGKVRKFVGGEVRLNPDGTIDEIVAENASVHLEQMDEGSWFLGITTEGNLEQQGATLRCGLFTKHEPVNVNAEADATEFAVGFELGVFTKAKQ